MYSDFRTVVKTDRNVDSAIIKVNSIGNISFHKDFERDTTLDFTIEPFDVGEGRYFLVIYPHKTYRPGIVINLKVFCTDQSKMLQMK